MIAPTGNHTPKDNPTVQTHRPRLTQFHELQLLVAELRKDGLAGVDIYKRLTHIGIIDLDVIDDVMKHA